jgi:flagellar biosynthesis/type III secretory pathway protein FliH
MFTDGVDHDEIAAERHQWVREQLAEAEGAEVVPLVDPGQPGFRELIEQLQQKLDEVTDAAEELEESGYQRGADAGYQDGLNDALRFIGDYRRAAAQRGGSEDYLDALDDAMSTLEENGAEATIVTAVVDPDGSAYVITEVVAEP